MLTVIKDRVKSALSFYTVRTCRREYLKQSFFRFNERPVELAFLFGKLAELYPKRILDVGTGTTSLPQLMRHTGALVTSVDNIHDYWPAGMFNRHYHVIDDDICDTKLQGEFDFITCISVLEHIENADVAVKNMFSLLAPGGHLLLSFPYREQSYIRNVYELPGSSYGKGSAYITQSYSRTELDRWMADNGGVIVDQEYWKYWSGEHWTVGEQIIPPTQTAADQSHQLTCLLVRKA